VSGGRLARAVEQSWDGDGAWPRALHAGLVPLAAAYGAAVGVRGWLYDRGLLRAERVPARVVSVGNLTVGGTGKTPTVLWLVERLLARGRRVAVVSRGYGKRAPGVVVVADGTRVLASADDGGDEAVLVATRAGVPVVTGERRAAAAALACARFGVDTVVLDDGFQHRALARDADLVLLPAGGLRGGLLPAGPLREPASALARATAVLAIADDAESRPAVAAPPGVPCFVGRVRATAGVTATGGTLTAHDLATLPRSRVVAVAGIARPDRFWRMLARLGIDVDERLAFADHQRYGSAEVAAVRSAAAGGRAVVTTEKDLVKLGTLAATLPLHAVRIGVEVEDGERLVARLAGGAEVALRAD
jgi:tetraacyldisaccharide 4'-kinase